jgi:butyryl-CoA dehydrogenase
VTGASQQPFVPAPGDVAREFAERFGPFLRDAVNPRIAAGPPSRGDRDLLVQAGQLGLLGLPLPESAGGGGRDPFAWGIALEQLARSASDASFPLLVAGLGLAARMLAATGRPRIIDRWVRPVARGRALSAWTTSDAGGGAPAPAEMAVDGDGYRLQARDLIAAGGPVADHLVCHVRDPAGRLFLAIIDVDRDGVALRAAAEAGARAAFATVDLDGVRIEQAQLVECPSDADHRAALHHHQAILICCALGRMLAAADRCVASLRDVVRDGSPLTEHLDIKATLGSIYAAVEVSRTVTYRALDRLRWARHDRDWDPQVSLAKCFVAEQAIVVAHAVTRLVGNRRYVEDPFFEQYLRDAMMLIPSAGVQDAVHVSLGEHAIAEHEARHRDARGAGR